MHKKRMFTQICMTFWIIYMSHLAQRQISTDTGTNDSLHDCGYTLGLTVQTLSRYAF